MNNPVIRFGGIYMENLYKICLNLVTYLGERVGHVEHDQLGRRRHQGSGRREEAGRDRPQVKYSSYGLGFAAFLKLFYCRQIFE